MRLEWAIKDQGDKAATGPQQSGVWNVRMHLDPDLTLPPISGVNLAQTVPRFLGQHPPDAGLLPSATRSGRSINEIYLL